MKELLLFGGGHDHVADLANTVGNDGDIRYVPIPLAALTAIVLDGQPFDACEFSLASLIMLHARGRRDLLAIPAFPYRGFRNTAIHVARDSAIESPRDLAGGRIGVGDFAATPAVWTRGHLHDDHGLDWRTAAWLVGPTPRFPAPVGLDVTPCGDDPETLTATGAIDALLSHRPRDAALPAAERRLRPLIADGEARERRYFDATGIFPIHHTVVLSRTLAEKTGAPHALFDAYAAARRSAIRRRLADGKPPLADCGWASPGSDLVSAAGYGLTPANRRAIAALSRYLREQGLIDREPAIDGLFVAGSAGWGAE